MKTHRQLFLALLGFATTTTCAAADSGELEELIRPRLTTSGASWVLTPQAQNSQTTTWRAEPMPEAVAAREMRQCTPADILEQTAKLTATVAACRAHNATCINFASAPCAIAKGKL